VQRVIQSPNQKFTQDILFYYDHEQVYNDANLKRIHEIRRKLQHEEYIKANPFNSEEALK
jgi:hypothetical protein